MPDPDRYAHISAASMLRMGLNPITDEQWLAPFSVAQWQRFHQHKRAVLGRRPDAILADSSALPALQELQEGLAGHLRQQHAGVLEACAVDLATRPLHDAVRQLARLSLWIPDDICILQEPGEADAAVDAGDYVLSAVSVLSPSHWRPSEKFMRPLSVIHQPVPGFNEQLTPNVSRFFKHLKVQRPVLRYNWGIQAGNALDWHDSGALEPKAGTVLYYRSERQTLVRLEHSQAVVFFIRIDHCPLHELDTAAGKPGLLAGLLSHINALPASERIYKGIDRLEPALEKYRQR